MNVVFYLSDMHACGYVRGDVPAREINRSWANWHVDCKGATMISDLYGMNVMVFQRAHSPGLLAKMLQAKSMGIKTVYDIDDDLLNIPPEFDRVYQFYSRPDVRETIEAFLQGVDGITVSTRRLAEAIAGRTPRTPKFVVKNALDTEFWEGPYFDRPGHDGVVIGWMASGSHVIDAPIVAPAVVRLMEKYPEVRCHLIGWVGWKELGLDKFGDRVRCDEWQEITRLPWVMNDFDIGIAPLADNDFNACKSNLKALQYWGVGAAVVASDSEPYRGTIEHGVTGYLAEPVGWEAYLEELIVDKEKRRRMADAGRRELYLKWDIRRRAGDWIDAYNKMLGK
jgi:glycosyltransferase involved in cell wall biosynthesis